MKREMTLALAAVVGALTITVLSLTLTKGSALAVLILDYQSDTLLPYPLTIQNLMLMLFAVGLGDVLHRRECTAREASSQRLDLLPVDDRTILTMNRLVPVQEAVKRSRQGRGQMFLTELIEQCIAQFQTRHSVDGTHQVLTSMLDLEMHRVDLRYTLLRYLAWVIPTLGFIGTVVGIGEALAALKTEAGDTPADAMQLAIAPLAMAFNTTIMALILSAVLVLMIQFIQAKEEKVINDNATYCLRNLINRLHIPGVAQ